MSIKIYSGYKLPNNINLFEFQQKLHKTLNEKYVQHLQQEYVNLIVQTYDIINNNLNHKYDTYDINVVRAGIKRERMLSKFNENPEDISVGVYYNPTRNITLAYFFGPHFLEHILADIDGVEKFDYENQTDYLPENITKEEYEERLTIWEETCDLSASLSRQGLLIQCDTPSFLRYEAEELEDAFIAEIPSDEDRRRYIAKLIATENYLKDKEKISEEVVRAINIFNTELTPEEQQKVLKQALILPLQPTDLLIY